MRAILWRFEWRSETERGTRIGNCHRRQSTTFLTVDDRNRFFKTKYISAKFYFHCFGTTITESFRRFSHAETVPKQVKWPKYQNSNIIRSYTVFGGRFWDDLWSNLGNGFSAICNAMCARQQAALGESDEAAAAAGATTGAAAAPKALFIQQEQPTAAAVAAGAPNNQPADDLAEDQGRRRRRINKEKVTTVLLSMDREFIACGNSPNLPGFPF